MADGVKTRVVSFNKNRKTAMVIFHGEGWTQTKHLWLKGDKYVSKCGRYSLDAEAVK